MANDVKFGFVKRIKLNEDGGPPDMAGKFLGFLPVWMAPPSNLDAPAHEYQMMGLAVFAPLVLGSEENKKRTQTDLDNGCVRYEILMTSSIANQMQGVEEGETVLIEYTGQRQKSRRGFNVDLYNVKRDATRLMTEPFFKFLPTTQNWHSLPSDLQEAATRRKSLGLGALADSLLEMPALSAGSQEEFEAAKRREIWGSQNNATLQRESSPTTESGKKRR